MFVIKTVPTPASTYTLRVSCNHDFQKTLLNHKFKMRIIENRNLGMAYSTSHLHYNNIDMHLHMLPNMLVDFWNKFLTLNHYIVQFSISIVLLITRLQAYMHIENPLFKGNE